MELLPCPFCGEQPEAKIIYEEDEENSAFEFSGVRCKSNKCFIKPQVGSTNIKGTALKQAARKWNTRTPAIKNEVK